MIVEDYNENYLSGWVKIFRSFSKWEWYKDSKMVHLFIHLLISANHKDGKWRGQSVKRGQLITGLHSLSEQTSISIQSIRTCLSRLKSTNEITIKTSNKNSLITVVNYDIYQSIEITNNQTNKQLTNDQQTTNKQLTTNKNDKKEKNERNIVPPTFEMIKNYSIKRESNVNENRFFDFYQSKNWMVGKNKMKDWQAAFRTWEQTKEVPKRTTGKLVI
jgi:hypothetical protein